MTGIARREVVELTKERIAHCIDKTGILWCTKAEHC